VFDQKDKNTGTFHPSFTLPNASFCLRPAGLATAFSPLKKYAAHFFNLAFSETEEKEAAPAVAGDNSEKYSLPYFFSKHY